MSDILLVSVFLLVLGVFVVCGDKLPNGVGELFATLVGVFVGLRLEHRLADRKDDAEMKRGLEMLSAEMEANLGAARIISGELLDFPAVVTALFSLRDEFWSVVSRGKRGELIDLDTLKGVAEAYDAAHDLRLLAQLFFVGNELVRTPGSSGFSSVFDSLRKERATKAVKAIEAALLSVRARS